MATSVNELCLATGSTKGAALRMNHKAKDFAPWAVSNTQAGSLPASVQNRPKVEDHSLGGGTANPCMSFALLLVAGGCATVPMQQTGALSSYRSLEASDGILTHARVSVSKDEVLRATTIAIMPTTFSETASSAGLSERQRAMVANVIDRSMCIGLSERFHIVAPGRPADLTVHAVITYVLLTNAEVAGLSRAVSAGAAIAKGAFLSTPVPIPTPRIPIGLGGLAVEAEAVDPAGNQKAAMIWARGADAFTSKPKVSTASDPYDLAKSLAADFSQLLVTGRSPFKTLPMLPSVHSVASTLGGPPKEMTCDAYGREPGVAGLIGDVVGLPPEWTDKDGPMSAPAGAQSTGDADRTSAQRGAHPTAHADPIDGRLY